MTLQVGRVKGLLPDPGWSRSGDTLTFSGTFKTTPNRDPSEIDVKRMQVQNLPNNPDEEFYPVLYDADPSLEGYYRVLDSSVSALGPIRNGAGRWTITLERHPDGAVARQESAFLAIVRTNGHSYTSGSGLVGVVPSQDGARDIDRTSFATGVSVVTAFDSEGGTLVTLRRTISAAASGSVFFTVSPEFHNNGGCLLEEKVGGYWYPVIGHIPAKGRLEIMDWRVSNGRFRISSAMSGVPGIPGGRMTIERYDNTTQAWEAGPTICSSGRLNPTTVSKGNSLANDGATIGIVRNDLDAVVLSFSGTSGRRDTLTIRRGVPGAEMTSNRLAQDAGLAFVDTIACSALATSTAGIVTTSADANGNRWLLATTEAATTGTNGLTIGGFILSGSPDLCTTFVGVAAASPNNGTDELAQFLATAWVKTRMVVR